MQHGGFPSCASVLKFLMLFLDIPYPNENQSPKKYHINHPYYYFFLVNYRQCSNKDSSGSIPYS